MYRVLSVKDTLASAVKGSRYIEYYFYIQGYPQRMRLQRRPKTLKI